METIQEVFSKAKEVACQGSIALNRGITVREAMDLNITVNGPVSIKEQLIVVPINIFRFSTFKDYSKRVVLNRSDFSLVQILPA